MNDMLVGILGLAVIAATVISLTRGKMLPAMAFIKHIKASSLYVWGFSALCLLFAALIGLVSF